VAAHHSALASKTLPDSHLEHMLLEFLSFSFAVRIGSDPLVADDIPGQLGGFSTHALGLGL